MNRDLTWHRVAASSLVLLLLVGVTCRMLMPFGEGIGWALVLGGVTWPGYRKLRALLGNRPTVAAGVMTVLVFLAVALPIMWIVSRAVSEAAPAISIMTDLVRTPLHVPGWLDRWPWIQAPVHRAFDDLAAVDPGVLMRQLWPRVAEPGSHALQSVARTIFQVIVTLFTLFFVYRDGDSYREQCASVMRYWLGERADRLWNPIKNAMRAVFVGVLLAATSQGLVAALGYALAGLKAPALLGGLTAIAAMLPFGATLIWGSAAFALYAAGSTWKALFMLIWGIALVSTVDNIVRPLVISGTARLPYLQVFFAFLGAATTFGSIGLFLGPAMLAVWLVLWEEWAHGGRNTV
jgi:predicted PurR-regulated permease PerM